ncbi:hypothetical protein [Desulfosporosinus lacus]|uniref:hypothetical protein n=1 Tax=Desulfosporosinus lacus TaxID=329936 RepID=UPI001161244C|nr:hypothetical protein [Desulfosporosinus lacus]
MPTIRTIIKKKQPKVYEQLMAIYPVPETKESKSLDTLQYPMGKAVKISRWEIEAAMTHDSYRRGQGGIRQVRRGN